MRFTRSTLFLLATVGAIAPARVASAQDQTRVPAKGYAPFSKDGKFTPPEFDRDPVGDNDIKVDILYAGICHSDVHHAHEDW
jgi:uncharacterized zinc-type alcohol dehydrogenase-like protein